LKIETLAYPRATIVGNPSGGYHGRTISFTFNDFKVKVSVEKSTKFEIVLSETEVKTFENLDVFIHQIAMKGLQSICPLWISATLKRFYTLCEIESLKIPIKTFRIYMNSTIPANCGFGDESAYIVAFCRTLMRFWGIRIPDPLLAKFVREIEMEELGKYGGTQGGGAQVYNCLLYANFDEEIMWTQGYAAYIPLSVDDLPAIFIAYPEHPSILNPNFYEDFFIRYENGEREIIGAIDKWANLTTDFRTAMFAQDFEWMVELFNDNWAIRRKYLPTSDDDIRRIELMHSMGVGAKLIGQGGAIIGLYEGEATIEAIEQVLKLEGMKVLVPTKMQLAEA